MQFAVRPWHLQQGGAPGPSGSAVATQSWGLGEAGCGVSLACTHSMGSWSAGSLSTGSLECGVQEPWQAGTGRLSGRQSLQTSGSPQRGSVHSLQGAAWSLASYGWQAAHCVGPVWCLRPIWVLVWLCSWPLLPASLQDGVGSTSMSHSAGSAYGSSRDYPTRRS
uniref:Uncharacterized protein n=1 Tax=Myotis myotis TaxID=51298 RepID=A0A7J7VIM7_MYOMY|nr:hypothetical protein mMyoMyo1_008272 [Myotis myotis]